MTTRMNWMRMRTKSIDGCEKTLMTTRMNWMRMRTKSIDGCDLGCPWQATLTTDRDLPWPEGTLTDPGLQTATDVWRRCLRRSWGDSSFAGGETLVALHH